MAFISGTDFFMDFVHCHNFFKKEDCIERKPSYKSAVAAHHAAKFVGSNYPSLPFVIYEAIKQNIHTLACLYAVSNFELS